MSPSADPSRISVKPPLALAVVFLLWAGYTLLQTLGVVGVLGEAWSAVLAFLPGILGVGVLLAAGWSRQACFLIAGRLSRPGFLMLAAVFVFALSAILPVMEYQGWSWTRALVLAPASGIAQELFFRSSLLPAWRRVLPGRPGWALVGHSLLFGLWHIGPLFVGAPLWAVLAVTGVPFLCGLGWGWQVQRDRTVVWAMVQHSLIWVIGLQFEVAG